MSFVLSKVNTWTMDHRQNFISLDIREPIWSQFFTIAPLVVIGTKEGVGYDLAPKHLAIPLGFHNYFGFVCTPSHGTYRNIKNHGEFSVSYLKPDQLILASLSASQRSDGMSKSDRIVNALPTVPGTKIDAPLMADAYVHLECELLKIIDGFDTNSLITGKIVAASVDEDYLRISERDEQEQIDKNPLLAYLADGRYTTVRESFNFPYPKNFMR